MAKELLLDRFRDYAITATVRMNPIVRQDGALLPCARVRSAVATRSSRLQQIKERYEHRFSCRCDLGHRPRVRFKLRVVTAGFGPGPAELFMR